MGRTITARDLRPGMHLPDGRVVAAVLLGGRTGSDVSVWVESGFQEWTKQRAEHPDEVFAGDEEVTITGAGVGTLGE